MTTTEAPTTAKTASSTDDQAEQAPAKRIGSAIGAAAFGLGTALAVAALLPAWLAYTLVGLVVAWLAVVGVPRIRKWRSA